MRKLNQIKIQAIFLAGCYDNFLFANAAKRNGVNQAIYMFKIESLLNLTSSAISDLEKGLLVDNKYAIEWDIKLKEIVKDINKNQKIMVKNALKALKVTV